MTFKERLQGAAKGFQVQAKNSMGTDLARSFLRFGNNKPLVQDWSKVVITDKEMYTGYPYAAIDRRANKVATLAKYNLKTDAAKPIQEKAKTAEEVVEHPYLKILDTSKTFSNRKFWYDISTYLDLEGVYYLLVERTVGLYPDGSTRIGNAQSFRLLNPYNIRRIINEDTLEVGGYIETRRGLIREIPPQMIIEMRKLNPFDEDDPWSMTDAAKTAQFTLKQSGDYTRHSLKNNMAAPGIISTDVILDTQMFQNFVNRVTNQEKGLPLFGNGGGAISWDDMQIDMDKAALKDISEINRQELFAVSGAGKTMLAIEESGTTRDTAEIQDDLFVDYHALPQVELIIDALNQDYKIYYADQYETNQYQIQAINPNMDDKDAETKEIGNRNDSYKLYDSLVADGYDRDLAAKFANGDITLEELGDPKNNPRPNPIIEAARLKSGDTPENANIEPPTPEPTPKAKDTKKKQSLDEPSKLKKTSKTELHSHSSDEFDFFEATRNKLTEDTQGTITNQQGALQNAIINIDGRLVTEVINNLGKIKNAFDSQDDIITDQQKKDSQDELEVALATFYAVIFNAYGKNNMAERTKQYGLPGNFKLDKNAKDYIKQVSQKAAESHINTITDSLLKTVKNTYDENINNEIDSIKSTGRDVTDEDLQLARKMALEGASRQRIVNALKTQYSDQISTSRAKAIARTETNRAFTQSQYQADMQFLTQNDLLDKAYKQWTTRSDDPCPICEKLANEPPVPFKENFADLGEQLSASYEKDGKKKVLTQLVNFEPLGAGNAHVNCSCIYLLVIK